MFHFDDYEIENFDDYAIEELTKIVEKLYLIARQYKFGTEEFSFFVDLGDRIEKPIRIRKGNKMIEEMNKEINFEELKTKVEKWADDKDLLHGKNADKQFMKFMEEVFEFKTEFDNCVFFRKMCGFAEDEELMYLEDKSLAVNSKLEMGDIFVTLIILCKQLGIDCVECLDMAYDKISKRKGVTKDGIFVKEEDL